ncbi:hypothetical protein KEJ51_06120 [Candidatus Bathyarchaeota archaeon]|nr:hypothetical protein [Candidatus Bathyarchaeota archaeon]MBS7631820.1 hypothetical protein [Candidatus Bathyarchaeota archaeon]
MAEKHYDNYHKWLKWAYEQKYGKGSWDRSEGKEEGIKVGFQEYQCPFKLYWNEEQAIGILERNNKFIGVACLVAKEVVDKESFVRKFGLSFEKDIQWKNSFNTLRPSPKVSTLRLF